jgi:crotonobetainyl-CoA:carnitine CoA-transferase CaiB-like acyl-CoA transferase
MTAVEAAGPHRGALGGVRVVEMVDEPVDYCGRLLAGLGAEVIVVEPPEGKFRRHHGPYVEGREGDVEASLGQWHFDVGKRSVVLDDDAQLRRLCRSADVVIHTMGPAAARTRGLDHDTLAATAPGLISCAITAFGQSGPWADYVADDLVLMALGGSMATCGYGLDDPPLACAGDQAWLTAATYGAIAILAALEYRTRTGTGQLIDVSAHQASASMTEWHVMTYICSGRPMARFRHPTVTAADGKQVAALVPDFLGAHVFEHFRALLISDGVAGPLADPEFEDPRHRARNYGELMAATDRLAAGHGGEELFRLGQRAGLPWGVIRSPDEALDDGHLQARGHWVEIDGVIHAGAPFVAGASPFAFDRPPPRLGQHTAEIMDTLTDEPTNAEAIQDERAQDEHGQETMDEPVGGT